MRLNVKSANYMKSSGKKSSDELNSNFWPIVKECYDFGVELRRPYEREWMLNLAFLAGRQYVFFNSQAHILQQIARAKGRVRSVDNIVLPKWRRQVADLIRDDPQMVVVPNTNEDEDIKSAKIGTKALGYFWRTARMKKKRRELAGWIYATGNGFLDDRWNTRLGPTQVDPQSGKLVYLGDVDAGVWSPFEILAPAVFLGDTDIHRLPWLIKAKWRTLDYIRGMYGRRGELITSESVPQPVMGADLVTGRIAGTNNKTEGAILIDLYHQPCNKYPNGLAITGANGVVLQQMDYPYSHYSVEHFKDIDVPGVFWGRATLTDAVPLQVRWNKDINSLSEFNMVASKGKLLTPRGAQIEVQPDDTHGEIVTYKPVMGHKPDWLQLKSMPPTIELSMQSAKISLEDLYSSHEVSRGTNKSDIRSGEMVSLLLEQDAFGKMLSHAVFEESLEQWGSRILKRMQDGYESDRMIKIVGRDNEFEVLAFKGADLHGNTDVSVKRQSSLPDSRVLRNAEIMSRFEKGLYGDPMDPEVRRHVMNMLDDAVVDDIYSDTKLDEAYARYENNILASGSITELHVNQYDNHGIHLQEHNHFRKSLDYQKLKIKNRKQFLQMEVIFESHTIQHQMFIQQMEMQMIQRQAMIDTAQKEKGGENAGRKA